MPSRDYVNTTVENVDAIVKDVIERWKTRGGKEETETLVLNDGSQFNLWLNPPRIFLTLLFEWQDERADHIIAALLGLSYKDYADTLDLLEWGAADQLVSQVLKLLKERREAFLSRGVAQSSPS